MKGRSFLLGAIGFVSGCAIGVQGHLYPVRGPLSQSNPPTIVGVSLSGVMDSGSIEASYSADNICKGPWRTVDQADQSSRQMAADWDQVYGDGFFVANVLGQKLFVRGNLACGDGSTLLLEFVEAAPGFVNARGVAKDERGNVFKLTF